MDAQLKIKTVTKSSDSHFSNITALFVTPDYKSIITGSMDTLIKVWEVSSAHDSITNVSTTITTKNGGINVGLQDKSG